MSYVVYRLVDPRTQSTFYVGVTDNLAARYIQHLRCSDKNVRKNERIQEIKDAHMLPIPDALEIIAERTLALKRERYWIQHYLYLGADLLNASLPAAEVVIDENTEESTKEERRLIGLTFLQATRLPECKALGIKTDDVRKAVKSGLIKTKTDGSISKTAVYRWLVTIGKLKSIPKSRRNYA